MPRLANFDREALKGLLDKQYGVVSRGQALDCAMTNRVMQNRLRSGGRWQALLPGIYLTVTGVPTSTQRQMAALLYAGPDGVITGPAALLGYGVRVEHTDVVDVLVPTTTQRRDHEYVRLHRTARLPEQILDRDGIRYAPAARAVADAVRLMGDLDEIRPVVADALAREICPLDQLMDEVRQGPIRGSALLRQAVTEVAGAAEAGEARQGQPG